MRAAMGATSIAGRDVLGRGGFRLLGLVQVRGLKNKSKISTPTLPLVQGQEDQSVEGKDGVELSSEAVAQAAQLFNGKASVTVHALKREFFPEDGVAEVAFAGKSNVGKSTLVNMLLGSKLSRVSSTAGCTKWITFYQIAGKKPTVLVDLPGYGFAKMNKKKRDKWNLLMGEYIRDRVQSGVLKRVFVLVDSRHGPNDNDKVFIRFLDEFAVPYQVVLTKSDRIKTLKFEKVLKETRRFLLNEEPDPMLDTAERSCHPVMHLVSSVKSWGVSELKATIINVLHPRTVGNPPRSPHIPGLPMIKVKNLISSETINDN